MNQTIERHSVLEPESAKITIPAILSFLEGKKVFCCGTVQIGNTVIKIHSINRRFKERYQGRHVDPLQQDELVLWNLTEDQVTDSTIVTELGGDISRTTLSHVIAFMMMLWGDKRRAEKFPEYSTIGFYVKDSYGELGLVGVSWWGKGLMIHAWPLNQPSHWGMGYKVVTTRVALVPWSFVYAKKATHQSMVEITDYWQPIG